MCERHYYRCVDCLTIAAADGPQLFKALCSLCGGKIEHMGRVSGLRLTETVLGCPCDGRCTGARGPNCDCKCDGRNHGSNLLVPIVRDLGPVPTLRMVPSSKAAAIAAEWRAGFAELTATVERLKAQRGALSWADVHRYRDLVELHWAITGLRSHPVRMRRLRDALPDWKPAATVPRELQAALF